MTEEMIAKLTEYIQKDILKSSRPIAVDEPLISSGMIDSFTLVDLSLFIEEEFGVMIDNTELNADTIDTLSQMADLISARR
ncbi:MAG: acyl carrier protein [Anaerolineae bacterium]|nr:acyl carrier protein [Anaerolineae bacterium]